MTFSEGSVLLAGALTLLMAVFHCFFPRIFNWPKEYPRLSGSNKRIFFTIHLALLLLFFIMAARHDLLLPGIKPGPGPGLLAAGRLFPVLVLAGRLAACLFQAAKRQSHGIHALAADRAVLYPGPGIPAAAARVNSAGLLESGM